jgi:lactate racemase
MTENLARPSPVRSLGGASGRLSDEQLIAFVEEVLAAQELDGRSVCLVVPDATRSCPLPLLVSAVHRALAPRVSRLTVLVALGTHAPMGEAELAGHLGYEPGRLGARYPGLTVLNHEWWDPDTLVSLGGITGGRVAQLSAGRLDTAVEVRINRAVVEHDVALVLGPVFPHEVVGFSGGNKYFFPGVAGPEIIGVSHWLGALITSSAIIGTRGDSPVRALIDEAAALIPARRLALCMVVESGTGCVHAVSYGPPEPAWAAAAEIAAQTHVRYLDAPVPRVLSVIPAKYDDMWTAAKGFYKLEPVVADGGELILYAPHVRGFSQTHPEIAEVGYHCRDYFLGQWDRYRHLPWAVLAHSTHLYGTGTWSPEHGERPRVRVTLATGIPEPAVRAANLGYLDPAGVDPDTLSAEPGTLVVPNAGEVLFRLR